mgnify:CR=1 FL=1
MNKTKNKHGMSTVVATLLMILLAITAITIVYSTIQSVINKAKYSPQVSCAELQLETPFNIMSACYNTETNNIEVKIRRGYSKIEIETIGFMIHTTADYSEYSCGGFGCGCAIPDEGNMKTYFFNEQDAEKIILKANNCILEEKQIREC